MKIKDKDMQKKSKNISISKVLYAGASVVGILGAALLIDNIYIFKTTIDQYVMQGYPAGTVVKSLIPTQLLPTTFEAIALYGGMALTLFGLGNAHKKISEYHAPQMEDIENIVNEIEEDLENAENIESTENLENLEIVEIVETEEEKN